MSETSFTCLPQHINMSKIQGLASARSTERPDGGVGTTRRREPDTLRHDDFCNPSRPFEPLGAGGSEPRTLAPLPRKRAPFLQWPRRLQSGTGPNVFCSRASMPDSASPTMTLCAPQHLKVTTARFEKRQKETWFTRDIHLQQPWMSCSFLLIRFAGARDKSLI